MEECDQPPLVPAHKESQLVTSSSSSKVSGDFHSAVRKSLKPFALPTKADTPQPDKVARHVFNVLLEPASQHAETVHAKYDVKVRDFAYQNTLPPVAAVPYIRRQVQPAVRTLKRGTHAYDEYDEEDEDEDTGRYTFSIDWDSVGCSRPPARNCKRKQSKLLRRTSTEPCDESQAVPSQRRMLPAPGSMQPRGHNVAAPGPSTSSQLRLQTPCAGGSQPLPLDPAADSQAGPWQDADSEPWIDTPLVTPNGSLQFRVKDTSAMPASQLDRALQLPAHREDITFSQLDLSPGPSQLGPSQLHAIPTDTSPSSPPRTVPPVRRRWSLTPSRRANRSPSPVPPFPLRASIDILAEKIPAAVDEIPENQAPRHRLREQPPAEPRPAKRARRGAGPAETQAPAAPTRRSMRLLNRAAGSAR